MLIDTLHYSVTLQMTITNSRLNIHENRIFSAIEKSMPDGIHVQGLIKNFKISPTTLNSYLSILEDDKKLIYHERIKNKNVYKINLYNQPTFSETEKSYIDEFNKLEITILKAINHSSKWSLVERLEVYHHVSIVISMTRYFHQMEIDSLYEGKDAIPEDLLLTVKKLDTLSESINKTMHFLIFQFHRTQIDNTVFNSLEFLDSITTKKRVKPSKFMKKIFEEMKDNPKVYETVMKVEGSIKKDSKKKR